MISINGKWALSTGASRGIGQLTALFMAEQGCNLIYMSLVDAVEKAATLYV